MDSINVKLEKLRSLMAENGIDAYLITKADPHQSENAKAYWNGVQFISGFKGSAGVVVVTKDKAGLWTDGRYAIQSREQVKGTEFNVYITSEPGTKGYVDFIKNEIPKNGRLGFDARTLSVSDTEKLESTLKEKEIELFGGKDLLDPFWENRAEHIGGKVFDHSIKYCGIDRVQKMEDVRKRMAEKEGDTYIISSLDDIAWLLNLRCADDASLCFPAYFIITKERNLLFANEEKLSEVKDILRKDNVEIMPYESINEFLKTLEHPGKVIIAPSKTSFSLYSEIKDEKIINLDFDITTTMKARKNPVEIENNKEISIKDGAALVKFIIWIKEECKKTEINEYEAGLKMDSLRAEIESFLHTSFSTICGYGPNAAQAHYRATEEKNSTIKPEGFLLVDSGGNYLKGTTDITRTFALGKITEEMKRNFTLVLKCHIALARVRFLYGTTGANLDILARLPLWEECLDFKHGTGHGIGFALNCHEGPHRINLTAGPIRLEEGMLVSNEPGFYVEDQYGIRSENIILVKEYDESPYGKFMEFETISFCPFDIESIDKALLTKEEIKWLNDYHKDVYEKLSPYLNDEETAWLKENTREI